LPRPIRESAAGSMTEVEIRMTKQSRSPDDEWALQRSRKAPRTPTTIGEPPRQSEATMANLEKLMQVNVPTWPFRIMNRCIIPLVISGGGSWRVGQTAQTPFEEVAGVLLVMAAAL